ncbi:ATP-binding protein [Alicyclobacillus fastidiosus]|uniref:ATP-binding protein n=1 Tax=Alicyclobacillus fastidiosus TaxID=392011 RepID=UPI0034D45958
MSDHGCGMTAEQLARIGTPFYSTKSHGTGLGLTSVFQCIQFMNGKIDVKSKTNERTTFKSSCPLRSLVPSASSTRRNPVSDSLS